MQQRALRTTGFVAPGIIAGLAGGIVADAFLMVVLVFVRHDVTIDGFYRFVASGALGPGAETNPSAVALGVALVLGITGGWGVGYAYVARRTPQIAARPFVSGLVFGFVVYFAMQLVEVEARIYSLPTPATLAIGLFSHCVCFGVVVAYTLRALDRSSGQAA